MSDLKPNDVHIVSYFKRGIIMVCIPSLGMVSIPWHSRMMNLATPMNKTCLFIYSVGMEVDDARNELVHACLTFKSDTEEISHVFFVDDDVLLGYNALPKLYEQDKDVISGLYYSKSDPSYPLMFADNNGGGVIREWEKDATIPVAALPMGCTLIKIDVFRKLQDSLPKNKKGRTEFFRTIHKGTVVNQITLTESSKKINIVPYVTEDVWFCRILEKHGIERFVDTSVFCWHWNEKEKVGYPKETWDVRYL